MSNQKKFQPHKYLFVTLFLYSFVYILSIAYHYTFKAPLVVENQAEFEVLMELTNLDSSLGSVFLSVIELVSYSNTADKSQYNKAIQFGDPFKVLKSKYEDSYEKSQKNLDVLMKSVYDRNDLSKWDIDRYIVENTVTAKLFLFNHEYTYNTNNLVLIGQFLDIANSLIKDLTTLDETKSDFSHTSAEYMDIIRHNIYNLISNVPDTFFKSVSSYLETFDEKVFEKLHHKFENHQNVYVWGYISGIVISKGMLIYALYRYQNLYFNLINCYGNLSEAEISTQSLILNRYLQLIKFSKYHEEKIMIEYTDSSSILDQIESQVNQLQNGGFNQIRNKIKVVHNKLFPGVKKTGICGGIITVGMFGFLVLGQIHHNYVDITNELQSLAHIAMGSEIDHRSLYLSQIFNTLFVNDFQVSGLPTSERRAGPIESLKFVTQFLSNDEEIKSLMSDKSYNRLRTLISTDICESLKTIESKSQLYYHSCTYFNTGVAQRGLYNYFFYENDHFHGVEQMLDSLTNRQFSITSGELFESQGLNKIWNLEAFLQVRLSELTIVEYYFEELTNIMKDENQNIQDRMNSMTTTIFVIYNILVCICLVWQVSYSTSVMYEDQLIISETFRVINFRSINKNAFILNKINKAYGVKLGKVVN